MPLIQSRKQTWSKALSKSVNKRKDKEKENDCRYQILGTESK